MNRLSVVGRIAGMPVYTPSVVVNGKTINAKTELTIIENDGEKKNSFRITGWGKQAENLAKGGAVGKAITIFGRLSTYKGRVWLDMGNGNRQPVQSPQGGDLLITKTGITLERLDWGADSGKTIAQEIQDFQNSGGSMGRPPMWQIPGSPDNQTWKNICAARKATEFQPGSTHFGYAEVRIPNGAQVAPPTQSGNQYANNGGHQGGFQAGQPNNNGAAQYGNPPQQPATQQGGFQGAANNQQVQYGGQNMGQAMSGYTGTGQMAGNPGQVQGGFQGAQQGNPPNQGYAPQTQGYAPNQQATNVQM